MADELTVAVTGAAGRMGRMLLTAAHEAPGVRVGAALERAGHDSIGADAGPLAGLGTLGVTVTDDPHAAFPEVDAVLDFTAPAATRAFTAAAAEAGIVHVIGTTGFADDDLDTIAAAAERIAIVRAGNMSLGVNVLVTLVEKVSAALGEAFDIDILDTHHAAKRDAPSGTALMLGEAAARGRGGTLARPVTLDRAGARAPGSIGFAALRAGDIVGEHDVVFAGAGEQIVLRHVATDRALFAKGAIRAALWAKGRPPGEYDMVDVLGLR